jgi:hypothetical protein
MLEPSSFAWAVDADRGERLLRRGRPAEFERASSVHFEEMRLYRAADSAMVSEGPGTGDEGAFTRSRTRAL